MSTILVFNDTLKGHRLEYFHHLYVTAAENDDYTYVFSYPDFDSQLLSEYDWPQKDNLQMIPISGFPKNDGLRAIWVKNTILSKIVKTIKPSRVILIDIMGHMPFLPFLVRNTCINGVIYGIYLYTWKKDSIKKKISHVIKYYLFSKFKVFGNIFIQSDGSSAALLNKKYGTNKFHYLCDPVVPIDKRNITDVRQKLGIASGLKIVLHPGDLSRRKGTIALLKGLSECSPVLLGKYYFIFAGRVSNQCFDEFYLYYNKIKEKTSNIKLIEGFLPFDYLGSLIYTSDLLFIPYLLTNQSSGIVGYAAEFNKPVVVTKEGLLAKIVKKNHIGFVIKDSSPKSIISFLDNDWEWRASTNLYMEKNTIREFGTTVLFN